MPESFEVLDGAFTSSLEELMWFLERVKTFPDSIFMLTNIQELPGNYQEALVNFMSHPGAASRGLNLHCVQFSDTMLHSSPWVEEIIWDDKKLKEVMSSSNSFKPPSLDRFNIRTLSVITSSSSGAGKTRFIKGRLEEKKLNDSVVNTFTISIHEGTTLDSLVQSLREYHSHESIENAVHFSFMMPVDKCDRKLRKMLNHFFNHLLLFRSVRSPTTGDVFIMGWSKWHIYVEIPSIGKESNLANDTSKILRCCIPVLSICATIEVPPKHFDIDDESRRVCTYLRAFSDGTINRKFDRNANKTLMFVIDDSGSMGLTLDDGLCPFEIAIANALKIFDTHVQIGDYFGTIIFNHASRVQVPLQEVRDDISKRLIREQLEHAPFEGGGTEMYDALNLAIEELRLRDGLECKSWIVCLTDGESDQTGYENLREALLNASESLEVIVIGVNLKTNYERSLRELCSKFGNADTEHNFISSQLNTDAMNSAFGRLASLIPVSETFELDGILSDQDCWRLISDYIPSWVEPDDMVRRKFWLGYLYRRVSSFDKNEDFNYNVSNDGMGSCLMERMLHEAQRLLSQDHNLNWKDSNHEQLIYDFTDPTKPQFRLVCTAPDLMTKESIEKYESLDLPGFYIPTKAELYKRSTLDRFLSQALDVPLARGLDGSESLSCIDENRFVLTLDFVMKLLNIHERIACRIPCVIGKFLIKWRISFVLFMAFSQFNHSTIAEGETGVSKTALTKMYGILRNSSLKDRARIDTEKALGDIVEELRASNLLEDGVNENSFETIRDGLLYSSDGTKSNKSPIAYEVHRLLLRYCDKRSSIFEGVPNIFNECNTTGKVLEMLVWFREYSLEQTFFELNVDASLNEVHVKSFFDRVSSTAQKVAASGAFVMVFLDGKCVSQMFICTLSITTIASPLLPIYSYLSEVNTSSIIGLFKEIIIDRSLCGEAIEDNIVIVAACNPSGRKSVSCSTSRESDLAKEWASGHYQVNELPQSMVCVKWQYGSLDVGQEKEFILRRMEISKTSIPRYLVAELTELIITAQEAIRSFAADEIEKGLLRTSQDVNSDLSEQAKVRARSVVSLRDIQRVFNLNHFFTTEFPLTSGQGNDDYRKAMYLTVAVVYYMRLDMNCRRLFLKNIASKVPASSVIFLDVLDEVMTKVARQVYLISIHSFQIPHKTHVIISDTFRYTGKH